MKLTIVGAIGIVAAAVIIVCLYRFTGIFTPKITERRIAQKMEIRDSQWVEEFIEDSLPPLKKDFSIYSAYTNSNGRYYITHVYATRAELTATRNHYKGLLENPRLSEKNDIAVLELDGVINGRKVSVQNFYSEVSNLIQVEMEMSGEYADQIWRKVDEAFPSEALEDAPEIAALANGKSKEGYIMWNFDTFADDFYASVPIFSRAYSFNGTMEELEQKIRDMGEHFDRSLVTEHSDIAKISSGNWLYQVTAMESFSGVKVALIIQEIPKG